MRNAIQWNHSLCDFIYDMFKEVSFATGPGREMIGYEPGHRGAGNHGEVGSGWQISAHKSRLVASMIGALCHSGPWPLLTLSFWDVPQTRLILTGSVYSFLIFLRISMLQLGKNFMNRKKKTGLLCEWYSDLPLIVESKPDSFPLKVLVSLPAQTLILFRSFPQLNFVNRKFACINLLVLSNDDFTNPKVTLFWIHKDKLTGYTCLSKALQVGRWSLTLELVFYYYKIVWGLYIDTCIKSDLSLLRN